MRRLALAAIAPLLLAAAASAPVEPARETVNQSLARARAEASAAERRATALQAAAGKAGDEAARLRSQQVAAAAAIDAAEARIAAADAALAKARAEVAIRAARLARRRAPVAGLLAGIVSMGRQPPLLALADGTSVEELVRVRALLDATMPVIARRSAALSAEVKQGEKLAAAAAAARTELADGRKALAEREARFAALERKAEARTAALAGKAFGEEDQVIAGGEQVADLGSAAAAAAAARVSAARVAELDFAPRRPFPAEPARTEPALPYSLPAAAPVIEGIGSVSPAGVAARGIKLATARGASLTVPADGRIAFAGPYRDYDGVVIIEHGHGWTSLLLNVATPLARGAAVRRGDPLGRALGDVGVELRQRGTLRSAALIAGSSPPLSNGGQTR